MRWLGVVFGAATLGLVLANVKRKPVPPPTAGPVGARWIAVPRVGGNLVVPFGTLFALRTEITDPATPLLVANATQANPALADLRTFVPGTAPPAGWPAEDDGASAYRVTAKVTDPAGLIVSSPTARMWTWLAT